MLHIDALTRDNVTILKLSGRLTSGIGCQSLAQHIRQMVATGSPRVLVQLNEVSLIDSAGVGELISSFTCVKKSGGLLKVSGANERVGEVLRMVRLPAIIDVFAGEAEALASFA